MTEINVTYYAGMVDRAGLETERYGSVSTLEDLTKAIATRHGEEIVKPLSSCSFLVNGRVITDPGAQLPGTSVEVLPPFAGG